MMKNVFVCLLSALLGFSAMNLPAQVPSMLNYQGRIAVSGVNFDGTGLFKFALVNGAGTQTYWSNNGTSTAGSEPTAAVSIDVESGIYSVKLGDTSLTNMTAVPATVFGNADVRLRVWFNDGVNGSQLMSPDQRIAAVGYAMMASTVQDGAITGAKIASGAVGSAHIANGAVGGTQLAAGAVTSALQAANVSAVAAGGIIGSNDPNNAALLAQGFVRDVGQLSTNDTWTTLPSGDAVAGHTAVWTGVEMIFWGGVVPSGLSGPGSTVTAINRGVKYNPTTGAWTPVSMSGAPQARFDHTAVWTGTEMLIFGGQTTMGVNPATALNNGGRYNPATNTWSYLAPIVSGPPPGMPDNRQGHLAFWTGSKMLVWGGSNSTSPFGSTMPGSANTQGKIYDPVTNTWSDMAMVPPEISSSGTWAGVWTGTQMILWSRQMSSASPPNAGRYNPTTNTWQTLPAIAGDPMVSDTAFSLVWSGTEMILWGGSMAGTTFSNAGYRFNPATDTWTTMATAGAPEARSGHVAAWIGSEMVIWGGKGMSGPPVPVPYSNGGRYDPVTNSWTPIAAIGAPDSRQKMSATAAGGNLLVWGGVQTSEPVSTFKFLKNGGSLNPATGTWTQLSNGSPSPRGGHGMIWTGTEMIIWGGAMSTTSNTGFDVTFNDGARYNPSTGIWTPLPATGAPAGRYGHSTVWTGTEMIVFGGQRFDTSGGPGMTQTLNSGARYNPVTNVWTATDTATAPIARSYHSAVWTGSKMIVWGGTTDGTGMNTNTGSVYDPATNTWMPTSSTGAPMEGANRHLAFWTGTDMILIGGSGAMSINSRYNPATSTWSTNASNPMSFPASLSTAAAAWNGSEALVGFYFGGFAFQLHSYSPVSNFWQSLPDYTSITSSMPLSVWTGSEMIVWGLDSGPATTTSHAGRYSAASGAWSTVSTTGAPTTQMGGAVWTGSEMLLWGGRLGSQALPESTIHDSGASYRLPQNYYFYRRP